MSFFKSKRAKVAGIVGGAVGIVGIALAAFLFTSGITGAISTDDRTADYTVSAVGGAGTGGMQCTATGAGRDITVNPTVRRYTSPGQPTQVPAQSCEVAMTVNNTGTQALQPTGFALNGANGIQVQPISAPGQIAGGTSGEYRVKLVVPQNAPVSAGAITGQITFQSVD